MTTGVEPSSRVRRLGLSHGVYFLALLILLVAAFYLEEDWRGARAWATCQRDLQGQGESLDWRSFIPPPVPDERNLAMAPLFVRELGYRTDPKSGVYTFGDRAHLHDDLKEMPIGGEIKLRDAHELSGWDFAKPRDLAAYQRYFRRNSGYPLAATPQSPAADVLLALSRYAPVLDELSQAAANRPFTRFPIDWQRENVTTSALSQYHLEEKFVIALSLRASAQLVLGHSEEALRDLALSLRLSGDLRDEPFVCTYSAQVFCLRMTLDPVWEGLAERRWSAAQLVRLQADLQRVDVLAAYLFFVRGERAFSVHDLDYSKARRDAPMLELSMDRSSFGNSDRLVRIAESIMPQGWCDSAVNRLAQWGDAIAPRGWYDLNKVTGASFVQDYNVKAVDIKTRRFFQDKWVAGTNAELVMPAWPTTVLIEPMLGGMGYHMLMGCAWAQTGLDEAVTACALERFFLDHHAYPARLDELVPAYLERIPTDIIDGAPLRYGLTPDGRYRLYGVGWNGSDDGGIVVWETPQHLKDKEGDWVWQYSELRPPAFFETK